MRIATWNVNSLNVRLEHLLTWTQAVPLELVCLQETKMTDDKFPVAALQQAGWQVLYTGQKSYNGMAIISRAQAEEPLYALPGEESGEKRFLAATIHGVRVVNIYVPNGSEVGSEKYAYKLRWLQALTAFLTAELQRYPRLLVTGDFNIAPEDRDVYDPAAWAGMILVSPAERAAFRALLALPLVDCLRRLNDRSDCYTWWDYRAAGFRRNQGIRIDHLLASPMLAEQLTACTIDTTPRGWDRPSDHTPLLATFNQPPTG